MDTSLAISALLSGVQPPAHVGITLGLAGAQAVDGQPGGEGDQPGLGRLHRQLVAAVPAQPGVLHHVLGVGAHTEHAVGDGEQAGSEGGEGGGVGHGVCKLSGLLCQTRERGVL